MAKLGAGIRKRADGTYEKRFIIDGKRYSIYGKTAKEVLAKEYEKRKQIEAGAYAKNNNVTLDKYFEEWKRKRREAISGNTLKTYTSYYNKHIKPVFGAVKVAKIERRQVAAFLQDLSGKLSNSTCNTVMALFGAIMSEAVLDGIVTKDATAGIKNLKSDREKATETIHRALTIDEQTAFIDAIKDNSYYEFMALMLCTGMRCGEVAALTWKDIDFKENVIHVTKTATYKEDGALIVGSSTKTSAGVRDIPINASIRKIIASQKDRYCGIIPMNTQRVFIATNGGIICNDVINDAISATLKKLKKSGKVIEHFTSHALRDTFATRYIEQGGTPQTLKTILGHSSLSMTMDLYAHVLPNTKQNEMNRVSIAI